MNFASTTATPPFDFVDFTLNFSGANPFGTNETLSFSTFNANNVALTSGTVGSGNSIYTSAPFGGLTENAIVAFNPTTELATSSFYAVITAVSGSFDLLSATADFEHIIFTQGVNQLGVAGTIASAVPLPAALPMFGAGIVGLGLLARRRKRAAAVIA